MISIGDKRKERGYWESYTCFLYKPLSTKVMYIINQHCTIREWCVLEWRYHLFRSFRLVEVVYSDPKGTVFGFRWV